MRDLVQGTIFDEEEETKKPKTWPSSANTVRRHILKHYNKKKQEITSRIAKKREEDKRYSVTMDEYQSTPYCDLHWCCKIGSPEVGSKPTYTLNSVRPFPRWKGKKTLVIKSIIYLTKIYIFIYFLYFYFSLLQKQVLET